MLPPPDGATVSSAQSVSQPSVGVLTGAYVADSIRATARQLLAAITMNKGLTYSPQPMVKQVVQIAKELEEEFAKHGI